MKLMCLTKNYLIFLLFEGSLEAKILNFSTVISETHCSNCSDTTLAEYFPCDVSCFSVSTSLSFIPDPLHPLWVSDQTLLQILQQLFPLDVKCQNQFPAQQQRSGRASKSAAAAEKCVSSPAVYLSIFPAQPRSAVQKDNGVDNLG